MSDQDDLIALRRLAELEAKSIGQTPPVEVTAPMPTEAEKAAFEKEMADQGFFEGIGESITGTRRATPTTESLPDYAAMPELNTFSMASFKSGLGTMMTSPEETVQVIQANFPGVQVTQDEKGNYLLQSSIDGKSYAIKPGFQVSDIPRAGAAVAAFTPAGRLATIPAAVGGAAATQAAIEASQAATGGEFNLGEVGLAALTAPIAPLLSRVIPPAYQAVKEGVKSVVGRMTPAVSPAVAPAVAPVVAPAVAQVTDDAVNVLVQKASGRGFGSTAARNRLADLAQINVAAKEAADRLGIELPADVFSDSPQVRAAAGLTRSVAGSDIEAAWRTTVTNAVDKADDILKQFDATFVEGAVAPGVVSQKIKDSLTSTRSSLNKDAAKIYNLVDEAVPKTTIVTLPKLKQTLDAVKAEVGDRGMSAAEQNLAKMISEGKVSYGRLMREKTLIGKALSKLDSPYGSMAEADLKRLYAALSDDQLTNVANVGGEPLRQQLRAANLLYAKERALGQRIVNAFGQDIEGSVANKMRTAITSAAKGDAGEFNRLLKSVPKDLQKETVATALASVTRSARGAEKGGFGFSEFADIYPKLRANPPVYKTIVDTLGKDSADTLRDLFEISKRVTEARAKVLTTGKANQAFANPEGLIGKVMESSLAQRAATTVVSTVPGGGAIAPDIINFMSKGADERVKAAGKLFADENFQKLAIDSAKGTPSAATLKATVMSNAFKKFADAAKLPTSVDARLQWLQQAVQAERQFDQENK
jgi:hypothetical protein